MVGDFFQLPPIGKGDEPARMLFESPAFQSPSVVKVKLTKVFRQKEPELLDLLEAARYGALREDHIQLLQTLGRPLAEGPIKPTKLYPINSAVDAENARRLLGDECTGPPYTYEALNTGRQADIDKLAKTCLASDPLVLREGAQVIYIVNSPHNPQLVNGSRGVVRGFTPTGFPLVEFAAGFGMAVHMHTWEFRPLPNRPATASRMQLPLKLAFAFSIHKSQGMSIDCVEVFLDRCFAGGMAYTALSRCTSLAGLRVHMSPALVNKIWASPTVTEFDRSIESALCVR